jgi:hypothetical protein
MKRLLSLQKTVEWQSLIVMGDDGYNLRVSEYTCNYDTWDLLSQDVPAPDLRDEGTPRHATSSTRIEFIWLHQNMGAKRPIFFIYKNDCAGREAPRYTNKKQDPQREAL